MYPNQETPEFIGAVDAWDSWKKHSPYRTQGEDLDLLFGYYGMQTFIEQFEKMRRISEKEEDIVEILYKIKDDYLNHKLEQAKIMIDEDGNRYWEIHIGESHSGIGNILEIANSIPEIKYLKAINLNDRMVSLYSLGFDVSEIARKNGGGGHTKASGYTIYN